MLDLLSALVDKSLVRAEERDGDVRYRMLETVREYAAERLHEAGETRAALRALFDWALELGEQSRTALRQGGEREWLPRLDAELDNLRAATTWALSSDDAPAGATRLPRSLMTYMRLRALLVEARSWIDAAIARCPDSDPLERVRLLVDAGILATMRDEHRRALGLYGEAIDVARARDFQPQLENALLNAGISCAQLGEYEAAIRYFHEALDVARRLGNRMGEAYVLTNLGMTLLNRDGPESAAEVMEAAHACAREVRATVLLPIITLYRGLVALARGDTAAAEPLLRDAVAQWRHSGERSSFGEVLDWLASVEDLRGRPELADELLAESAAVRADLGTRQGLIDTLDGHARVAFQRARWERALTLAGAAEAAREAGGNPLAPFDRRLFEAAHARAVAAIGEAAAGAAFEAGRAMALEDAVALARGLTGAPDGV